jgi:N-acetylglucosamine-6-phosphate deacetylase
MIYQAIGPEGFNNYDVTWGPDGPIYARVEEAASAILAPGFVDLHIHGAFGIDFMSASKAELMILCRGLAKEGYEHFLATTVTASAEEVLAAFRQAPDDPILAGFHLEGPFISPKRVGAQPPEKVEIAPLPNSAWDAVLDDPRLKYATIAPEIPHALETYARLLSRDVFVSMGHSNATFDEARRGSEFGAKGVTHMFNAMREFHHREAGIIGYALSMDDLYTELIYDRLHVGRDAASLLFRCKGPDRVIAVSDGTKAIGLPPGEKIDMWGHGCVVGRGEVRLADGGLAGSAITLQDAFANLAEDFGVETAIRCCCINPRNALGLTESPKVWLEIDGKFRVQQIRRV